MTLPLVTIGIPVYKRLRFLPEAVQSVAAQDYPHIELIVSDNGMNGTAVSDLVKQHYEKPFQFRQNPSTINATLHYNQIIHEAKGEYITLLGDDDEISPNFVSDLMAVIQRHPEVGFVVPRQEHMDEQGHSTQFSSDTVPELFIGEDFIRAWCKGTYGWMTFSTVLMKTSEVRRCGGFVVIPTGNGDEDALLIKMSFSRPVGASGRSTVRKRQYPTSLGYSCSYPELTNASRRFIRFLDGDPLLQGYAKSNVSQWKELRGVIIEMLWKTCYERWRNLYRGRLSTTRWVAVALTMPWIPSYYHAVWHTVYEELKFIVITRLRQIMPFLNRRFKKTRLDHE